jgi:hypothetical protein
LGGQTETFNVQLKTRPILRLLGIHWGQFPERWDVKGLQESIAEDQAKGIKSDAHYIVGVSGMTLVAPASKIMEMLDMPKMEAKRIETERLQGRPASVPKLEARSTHLPHKEDENPSDAEDFSSLLDAAVNAKPSTG